MLHVYGSHFFGCVLGGGTTTGTLGFRGASTALGRAASADAGGEAAGGGAALSSWVGLGASTGCEAASRERADRLGATGGGGGGATGGGGAGATGGGGSGGSVIVLVEGGIGSLGPRGAPAGSYRIRNDGFELGPRLCNQSHCVRGGVTARGATP